MTSLKRNRSAKVSKRPSGLPKLSVKPPQVAPAPAEPGTVESLHDAWDYGLDVWQRTVLFWDTLRQRADNMLEHEHAGFHIEGMVFHRSEQEPWTWRVRCAA